MKEYLSKGIKTITTSTPTGSSGEIPLFYRDLFIKSGNKFNVEPALIAAIFSCGENGNSWPDQNGPWKTSNKNAKGPFQFLDSTWQQYGFDGDNDGDKDIQDITDSSYGAANYLKYGLTTKHDTSKPREWNAAREYNHNDLYADKVYDCYQDFSNKYGSDLSKFPAATTATTPDLTAHLTPRL